MTVTELAHFQTRSGDLDQPLRDLMASVIKVQDQWCRDNLGPATPYMTKGPEARGVGLFQRIDDPSAILLTAHWESVEQHGEWIDSTANRESYPPIQEHLDMSKLVFFHIEGVAAFEPEVLEASVVGVLRYAIPKENRAALEERLRAVKGGWRNEKDEVMTRDDLEEFVIVLGSDTIEGLESLRDRSIGEGLGDLVRDEKYYRRVL